MDRIKARFIRWYIHLGKLVTIMFEKNCVFQFGGNK